LEEKECRKKDKHKFTAVNEVEKEKEKEAESV